MADNKPPKINENKPKSEDKFPNPRSWMLWALGIFMVVMLFQIGSSAGQDPKEKVNYDMLQEWINSGADVKGFIEYPPPNSSALCTITGYRIENGIEKKSQCDQIKHLWLERVEMAAHAL